MSALSSTQRKVPFMYVAEVPVTTMGNRTFMGMNCNQLIRWSVIPWTLS